MNKWIGVDLDGTLAELEGEITVSKSGATSTKLEESYHLIPFAALRGMAKRFWFGAQKHAARNWELGDEEFAEIRLSHCYRHMALFAEFRRLEDLEAVLCNAAMLAYYKEKGFLSERECYNPDRINGGKAESYAPSLSNGKSDVTREEGKGSVGGEVEGGCSCSCHGDGGRLYRKYGCLDCGYLHRHENPPQRSLGDATGTPY